MNDLIVKSRTIIAGFAMLIGVVGLCALAWGWWRGSQRALFWAAVLVAAVLLFLVLSVLSMFDVGATILCVSLCFFRPSVEAIASILVRY
jgi:hypothetical protein